MKKLKSGFKLYLIEMILTKEKGRSGFGKLFFTPVHFKLSDVERTW